MIGIEPILIILKTTVLPLNYTPSINYYFHKSCWFSFFFKLFFDELDLVRWPLAGNFWAILRPLKVRNLYKRTKLYLYHDMKSLLGEKINKHIYPNIEALTSPNVKNLILKLEKFLCNENHINAHFQNCFLGKPSLCSTALNTGES